MKGVVFTEFIELVESHMGLEMVDRIIADAELPNNGAYTAVGTYDHAELVRLVQALSAASGKPVPELIHMFGGYLFQRFAVNYAPLFEGSDNAFDFLDRIENVIHVEVRKLYPDAELPSLPCTRPGPDQLQMLYSSPRGFGDLAAGLIDGCIRHFASPVQVQRTDLPKENGCFRVQFDLRRTVP